MRYGHNIRGMLVTMAVALAACESLPAPMPAPGGGSNDTAGQLGDATASTPDGTGAADAAPGQDAATTADSATTAPADAKPAADAGATPGDSVLGDAVAADGSTTVPVDAIGAGDAVPGSCKGGDPGGCPGGYCATPAGQCGGPGECKAKPTACPAIGAITKTCGCDGKTYETSCQAAAAGTSVQSQGACAPVTKACGVGMGMPDTCAPDEYCVLAYGACTGKGQCATKPKICTMEYAPVCGCDGKSYSNKCAAAGAGQNISPTATCAGPPPPGCTVGDASCGPGHYCGAKAGVCKGAGTCTAQPTVCTKELNQVCGCNNLTYSNPCMAAAAGAVVQYGGPCKDVPPNGCMAGDATCAKGEYCATPSGVCAGPGACSKKPDACIMLYAPVCGCDGKTHGNSCAAASAGVNVSSKGECAGGGGNTQWYMTCGAPVCSGWKANPQVPLCTTEQKGGACKNAGDMCDPQDGCNAYLLCTDSDPTMGPVGCPKSRRSLKSDITYVTPAEARSLHDQVLQTKLATYRYTAMGENARRHLGFIIEDQPAGSAAVDPGRDMVELYGYLSMSVAALQEQARRIEVLQRRVDEFEALQRAQTSPAICR